MRNANVPKDFTESLRLPVTCKGQLEKVRASSTPFFVLSTKWDRRHFELRGYLLIYYSTNGEENPMGFIDLRNFQGVSVRDGCVITLRAGGKVLLLRAPSRHSCESDSVSTPLHVHDVDSPSASEWLQFIQACLPIATSSSMTDSILELRDDDLDVTLVQWSAVSMRRLLWLSGVEGAPLWYNVSIRSLLFGIILVGGTQGAFSQVLDPLLAIDKRVNTSPFPSCFTAIMDRGR